MFLHVGADVVVSIKRVVAILDLRSSGIGEPTRDFLVMARKANQVTDISGGAPKSLVLTADHIFLSPISSLTLKKRADFLSNNVALDLGVSSN